MGQPQDHYNELLPKLSALNNEQLVKPFASIEAITSYADGVLELLEKRGDSLIEEGIKPLFVHSLKKRINAYAVAEMNSSNAISTESSSTEQWNCLKSEAQRVKGDLTLYGEIAYEEHPKLMEKLNAIKSGQGNDDLIHDMLDLSGLFRENLEPFAELKKFDTAWIDRSEELFTELRDIRAMVDDPDSRLAELSHIEKQAYSYLDQAMKEIRRFGRLAFRNEPELLAVLKQTSRI